MGMGGGLVGDFSHRGYGYGEVLPDGYVRVAIPRVKPALSSWPG
jgi:hypothetical protein